MHTYGIVVSWFSTVNSTSKTRDKIPCHVHTMIEAYTRGKGISEEIMRYLIMQWVLGEHATCGGQVWYSDILFLSGWHFCDRLNRAMTICGKL